MNIRDHIDPITGFLMIPPGQLLKEEFLDPMGITIEKLCNDTGLDASTVTAIIDGTELISLLADTKLCEYFGLSKGYWIRAQCSYELRQSSLLGVKWLERK